MLYGAFAGVIAACRGVTALFLLQAQSLRAVKPYQHRLHWSSFDWVSISNNRSPLQFYWYLLKLPWVFCTHCLSSNRGLILSSLRPWCFAVLSFNYYDKCWTSWFPSSSPDYFRLIQNQLAGDWQALYCTVCVLVGSRQNNMKLFSHIHGRLNSLSLCKEFHCIVQQKGKWIISEKVSLDWEASITTLEGC